MLIALFPIAYVVSAAFNADQTLGGASLIPARRHARELQPARGGEGPARRSADRDPTCALVREHADRRRRDGDPDRMLGALAAYAFSRFRFKGRRMGLLALLLIQMFPQLLLVVAIYLIVLQTGDVFGGIGLNTLTGLDLVYLGGDGGERLADEGLLRHDPGRARRVGPRRRSDAQVFWGVILPLAAPVLAVVGLFSFIGVINEFVIASVILQNQDQFTLALGLRNFIDQQYSEHWGAFAAGVLLAARPWSSSSSSSRSSSSPA